MLPSQESQKQDRINVSGLTAAILIALAFWVGTQVAHQDAPCPQPSPSTVYAPGGDGELGQ